MEKEFSLLSEYMGIYIQLLAYSLDKNERDININQFPSFDYFKSTYSNQRYSLSLGAFEDKAIASSNKIVLSHTHGIKKEGELAKRRYTYWMGCKIYTNKNINGKFELNKKNTTAIVNKLLQ